jgi:D-tyrosyl-tRNA(Tyr) deacylase
MIAVVQRVKQCSVVIRSSNEKRSIGKGLLVFLAIRDDDNIDTIRWFVNKIVNLRIFPDTNEKMNLSVQNVGGEIMVISNFTLYGDVTRGFRPNFTHSASPEVAEPIYNLFVEQLKIAMQNKVAAGEFGAMMDIELVNDGPVTIIIEK